jgi:predicted dithiol-disulfide oxidoreductase (DUF899 family)
MDDSAEHTIVGHDEWLEARRTLLLKEKEFTRLRDELSRERRRLPWERVEKEYVFDGPDGKETIAELFDGRSQLVVYHFMFDPDDEWDEACKHCSFWADNFDPIIVHLNARDVTMVAVSRAQLDRIDRYRRRLGWSFKWVSSYGSDFNYDFGVSFAPGEQDSPVYNLGTIVPGRADREGVSVFVKDASGQVFRAYSTYARGIDMLNTAYHYLDLVPKGRGEEGQAPQYWVRRHDEYDEAAQPSAAR